MQQGQEANAGTKPSATPELIWGFTTPFKLSGGNNWVEICLKSCTWILSRNTDNQSLGWKLWITKRTRANGNFIGSEINMKGPAQRWPCGGWMAAGEERLPAPLFNHPGHLPKEESQLPKCKPAPGDELSRYFSFGQHSQAHGGVLGVPCAEPGAGLWWPLWVPPSSGDSEILTDEWGACFPLPSHALGLLSCLPSRGAGSHQLLQPRRVQQSPSHHVLTNSTARALQHERNCLWTSVFKSVQH